MRKIYLLLLFVFTGSMLFAQCPAVSDFSESFDASNDMPDCWNTLRVNPPASPFAVIQVQTVAANSYSPPNSVRMFNQLGGSADFYLITPKVDNLADGTHQLRFVYRGHPNTSGVDAIIEVGTMTDPADETTFTLVETLTGTTDAYKEYTIPFTSSSTDQYIAIKADYQVTFRNLYLDDINWEAMPTCPKPTDLVATNITSSSADLSWIIGSTETEWEIVYGEAGFDPDTQGTTITDSDTLGETIENLEIGTDYEFYVTALCGVGDISVRSFPGAFTTLCDVYPQDFLQEFSTFIPNCWEEADAGSQTTGPTSLGTGNWTEVDYLNDPTKGRATKIILFSNTVSDWLISPQIELTSIAELSYNVGITTLNGTTSPTALGDDDLIQVLITADGGTTWEILKSYDNNDFPPATGITETIDLSAYSGIVQFAFWATDGAASDAPASYDVFFDNFAVNTVLCPAVSEFSESFDASNDMPECWNTLRVNPPASPFAVIQVQTVAANSYSPPNSVRMFNQLGGSADFYLITPKVDNLADGTHQLRFVYRGHPNTSGVDAIIEVGTMTDPADETTFTLVETLTGTTDAYKEYTIPFTSSSTDQYIAIKADYQVTFRNLYLDDINWEAMPTCPKPTDLVATNITSSSVDLSWIIGSTETEWEIVYGEAGFDPDTQGTTITDSDALGETIENLEIGTDYEFYVTALCGVGDISVRSFPGAFTTLCDVYPQDFLQEFSTFIPNCWEEADAGSPTTGPTSLGTGNWTEVDYLNDPTKGRATKIILFSNTVSDWLISPQIELTSIAELSYNVGITTLNGTTSPTALGDDDLIQVLITADGGTTWEILKSYDNNDFPPATGITETIDLSAYSGIVQFAFWATDGAVSDAPASYDVFFDNFAVNTVILPCEDPSAIVVGTISNTTAIVTWTENGTADSWEVTYGVEGFDPQTQGTTITVDTNPETTLTNLNPDTTYDVYAQAICSPTDASALIGPEQFTTTNLSVNDATIQGFVFYPNPVDTNISMQANSNIDQVIIYNIMGQVIHQESIGKSDAQIEVSNLASGIYLMQVTSGNISQTVKIIKK